MKSHVVPAKAGTHTPQLSLLEKTGSDDLTKTIAAGGYGSLRSQGRRKGFELNFQRPVGWAHSCDLAAHHARSFKELALLKSRGRRGGRSPRPGLNHKLEFALQRHCVIYFLEISPYLWPYLLRRPTAPEGVGARIRKRARPSLETGIARLPMPAPTLIITIAPDPAGKTTMRVSLSSADGAPVGPSRDVVLNDRLVAFIANMQAFARAQPRRSIRTPKARARRRPAIVGEAAIANDGGSGCSIPKT